MSINPALESSVKLRVLLAAAAVALGLIAAPAVTSAVSSDPVAAQANSNLSWSGRKSLTEYVGGPAQVTVSEGATKLKDNVTYDWPFVSSDYNPSTKTGSINFKGKVDWWHSGYNFHVVISNPSIVYKNGVGQLWADVHSTLEGQIDSKGRDAVWDLSGGDTIVTEAGEKLLAFYAKGEKWDPVNYQVAK
ncbi:hypothetical protein D5S17_12000 [Pseudonocardiaceae bacterium YIM PH 21723]|nr:hypothetical protein D5S17_12000 [Pseudonocardiaceae bacterium YIM PH 21723]